MELLISKFFLTLSLSLCLRLWILSTFNFTQEVPFHFYINILQIFAQVKRCRNIRLVGWKRTLSESYTVGLLMTDWNSSLRVILKFTNTIWIVCGGNVSFALVDETRVREVQNLTLAQTNEYFTISHPWSLRGATPYERVILYNVLFSDI